MYRIFKLLPILVLAGCITAPDWETGEGCWRYKVAETGNTGPMTHMPLDEIPVVRLNYDDLAKACGVEIPELSWSNRHHMFGRACFKPREVNGKEGTDTINLYRFAGKMALYEERCHVIWGRKHNNCSGYGIGKDCNWNNGEPNLKTPQRESSLDI